MNTIERIRHMESLYDLALATGQVPRELREYYENGQWLRDYEADERGELPATLKRGVLSQDGLWDLLTGA